MPQLVDGKIPAHTECPFKNECPRAEMKTCWHTGVKHTVTFSCGLARAYELVKRNEVK